MRITDLFESPDGPKQGTSITKTMNRSTFDLLKDLNQWQKEREDVQRDVSNLKNREYNKKRRQKNSFIWVGRWAVDVQTLEEWLETKDDNIVLNYAISNGWGLPTKNNPTYKLILDDPEYKEIILDIWKSAKYKYKHGKGPKNSILVPDEIENRLSILGRKHRISLHVDKHGRKLSPYIKHPESRLPQKYTHWSTFRKPTT